MISPADTPPPTSTWIPQFLDQNPNIQNSDVQPLEVNSAPNMLPQVSSGAEAIIVNVLPLGTFGMHQGTPTMGLYMPSGPSAPQKMIPPPFSNQTMMVDNDVESSRDAVEKQSYESDSVIGDVVMKNSIGEVSTMLSSITAASVIGLSSKSPSCSGCHGSDYDDDDDNYQDFAFDGMNLSLHDKQLIEMIPNTKDEVLSYEIKWDVSDQHELHKKMRPWILRNLLMFLEGDADGAADGILMIMGRHVCASQMLRKLQIMFQADMEMFFLNLWRMLIFEIKRKEEVAGFVKHFFKVDPKEERSEVEREINMQSGDSLSQRDPHCGDMKSSNCARDVNKDVIRDSKSYQQYLLPLNSFGLKRVWDFEQFIDMIPKTKEGLFSYVINWDLFNKHELHKRLKPWICKKIMEFYEEHETTTVDSIVNSIRNHARPSEMVDLVHDKLGDQDENFVLNMLRMLIFEIKKVETVEFADCISNTNPKKERSEMARGINMRSGNMSSHLNRDYSVNGDVVMGNSVGDVPTMLSTTAASNIGHSSKAHLLSGFLESDYDGDANQEKKMSPQGSSDSVVKEKQKICDGEICQDLAFDGMKLSLHEKELIAMIPNANDEVLSYKIKWDVSDQHELHKKMKPWISKKITEFLEDDADGTTERILMSMCNHDRASEMLQMLQSMFEDDVQMFLLNLWRMIIFEIKKQEEVLEIQAHIYNYEAPVKSSNFSREVNVDKIRDSDSYQDLQILLGTFDSMMLREVEQFIDMIPKTKEMLFSHDINWAVSDKHELHKKMAPWISKNVTEFLEEDDVLVGILEYCIENHIRAPRVLETIQVIMKDESELFFLKFWRMLIFEIKKVETVAAFAKRFNVDPKEERSEVERALDTRSGDSSSQQDRHWNDTESSNFARDVKKDIIRDSKSYLQHHALLYLYDKKRLPDFEDFIDMIPKTKEELFSYGINWDLFDKHELHKRMRPWVSEKIMEFYEIRDATTVDSIVTSIKNHASSSEMVHLLEQKLGNQAEKFVMNMLRTLIFEIKKADTELAECISNANPKEERSEGESEINVRSGNMLSHLDLDQKTCDSDVYTGLHYVQMLFDSEQLRLRKQVAEKLPKTKEELYSYKIHWRFYEKYGLRWGMSRWISRHIKGFCIANAGAASTHFG